MAQKDHSPVSVLEQVQPSNHTCGMSGIADDAFKSTNVVDVRSWSEEPPLWRTPDEDVEEEDNNGVSTFDDEDAAIAFLRSELSGDKSKILLSQLEQRIQTAEQEAIRQQAITLLYQDELRIFTTRKTTIGNEQDQEEYVASNNKDEWRDRRRMMRHLQYVMREHSALRTLRTMSLELKALYSLAAQADTKITRLEIDNEVLKQALHEERAQNRQLAEEMSTLDATNQELRAKAEILGHRMAVAEHERNCLRRRAYASTSDSN